MKLQISCAPIWSVSSDNTPMVSETRRDALGARACCQRGQEIPRRAGSAAVAQPRASEFFKWIHAWTQHHEGRLGAVTLMLAGMIEDCPRCPYTKFRTRSTPAPLLKDSSSSRQPCAPASLVWLTLIAN